MQTLSDLFHRLEQLNDIGVSLSAERDIQTLLEKILLAAKEITRADGSRATAQVLCRIDTLDEVEYFKSGGVLLYVLRNLAKAA